MQQPSTTIDPPACNGASRDKVEHSQSSPPPHHDSKNTESNGADDTKRTTVEDVDDGNDDGSVRDATSSSARSVPGADDDSSTMQHARPHSIPSPSPDHPTAERRTDFRASALTTSIRSSETRTPLGRTTLGRTLHKTLHKPCNCCSWSRRRILVALFGCTSAALVCTARLLVDPGSTTYLIHSIIILLDMVLIHLFTYSPWLSMSGEGVTVISLLLFHYTHQQVFELIETTLLAALCSLHMIFSRNEHWDREEELEESLIGLRINVNAPPSSHQQDEVLSDTERGGNRDDFDNDGDDTTERRNRILSTRTAMSGLLVESKRCCMCGHHFFEHFLDGSAGVMYTSFVGLIIDEFIRYGTKEKGV